MLTVLIPASGFGKRNPDGQPVKELVLHRGVPLLEYSLRHLLEVPETIAKVVLITREAKKPYFEKWIQTKDLPFSIEFLVHEPVAKEEWPKTLLSSANSWGQKNWVLLPDTEISSGNQKLAPLVQKALAEKETWWGWVSRSGEQASTYGVISEVDQGIQVQEKPQTLGKDQLHKVWGSFGFRKSAGNRLLEGLEWSTQTHKPFLFSSEAILTELSVFLDHSRGN